MAWRIYYKDAVVSGTTQQEWIDAPDIGVQVVAVMQPVLPPYPDRRKTGFVFCGRKDRILYTGVDQYDPLGYGHIKTGLLIGDNKYRAAWERAYVDR